MDTVQHSIRVSQIEITVKFYRSSYSMQFNAVNSNKITEHNYLHVFNVYVPPSLLIT